MTKFGASIKFKGQDGKEKTRRLVSQDIAGADLGAETLVAAGVLADLIAELVSVTDLHVTEWSLTVPVGSNPGTGAGDYFNQALIVGYINADKKANFSIPGASDGIFVAATGDDYNVVDVNDADLQAYVTELSDHWEISDGESLDDSIGVNGMSKGRRNLGNYSF